MSVLANSLALARRSIASFPIWWPTRHHDRLICGCWKGGGCGSPAKHPIANFNQRKIAPNGYLDGTCESAILKLWFGQTVPDANLGIWCKDLIVLDIDNPDSHAAKGDGFASLAKLEAEHGPLPDTWRVITGSLGLHVFFRAPPGSPSHHGEPTKRLTAARVSMAVAVTATWSVLGRGTSRAANIIGRSTAIRAKLSLRPHRNG